MWHDQYTFHHAKQWQKMLNVSAPPCCNTVLQCDTNARVNTANVGQTSTTLVEMQPGQKAPVSNIPVRV